MTISSYTGDDQESPDGAGPVDIIMSTYIDDPEYSDDLLCATLINFMIAGRDTIGTALVWLFYNLAQNPDVVACIREELLPIASRKATAATNMVTFQPHEMKPLVYLHATLYESLRLFPPIPIERKTVVADDVLPSGHTVCAGDTVLVSFYSMGRMEGVWGAHCMEYKPERWLSLGNKGDELRYVPSHKFLAFNSRPRMCLGKDIAIMQMKTVVAAIVWNFDVEVLKGNSVQPKFSCILQMKNGLMVRVKKRKI